MRDLALDPTTRDLLLTRGADGLRRGSLTSGAGAVRQKVLLRLSLAQGEYPLDTSVGIPYFGTVFSKASGRRVAESLFRRAIATCPGVRSVESFALSVNAARLASLGFRVTTVEGESFTVTDFVAGAS